MRRMTIVAATKQQFLHQLQHGTKPGDRIIYHTGFLMWDRDPDNSKIGDKERHRIDTLAKSVRKAYEEGLCYLLQKRVDKRYGCEYIAVKA